MAWLTDIKLSIVHENGIFDYGIILLMFLLLIRGSYIKDVNSRKTN